jgi:hypothetical protein
VVGVLASREGSQDHDWAGGSGSDADAFRRRVVPEPSRVTGCLHRGSDDPQVALRVSAA